MRRTLALCLVFATLATAAAPQAPERPDTITGVERIVAVGDVHGDHDALVRVLQTAGVIDGSRRWTGGRTHLVQTGDILDRGPDSRQALDLLMRLERQAEQAGGRVHVLLGNHEVMVMQGDLRYVSPGEFAAFRTPDSVALRDRAYEQLADPARRDDPAYRRQWEQERPLGWVELREAFGPEGKYGSWLRTRHTVVKIDGYLFTHGGISPALVNSSISEINERVRAELHGDTDDLRLTTGADGPLWYRGLASAEEAALGPHVERVLAAFGATTLVAAHTIVPGAIVPRLEGRILLIDVGLSKLYGGRPICLVIERGRPFALHRGTRLPIPRSSGPELLDYLRTAAALDPQPSPLLPLIDAGGRLPLKGDGDERR